MPTLIRPAFLWLDDSCNDGCVVVFEAVVVDGLAEQCYFDDARICESFTFIDNVVGWSVHFRAAGERDDTVGAEFVAATRDANISGAVVAVGVDIGIECAGKIEEFELVFRCCKSP